MSDLLLSDLSYQFTSKINEILGPVASRYGIDRFFYTLYLPDQGKACFISNEPSLVSKIQEVGRFSEAHDNILSTVELGGTGKFIWPENPGPENGIGYMLRDQGVKTGVSLLQRPQEGFVKNIGFASTNRSAETINLVVNKTDIFNHFITYFESEASDIIEQIKKCFVNFHINIEEDVFDLDVKLKKECINSMKIKKLLIPTKGGSDYLTNREFQCLCLLCKGQSLKQIAIALSLSPRTVETYLQTCKSKLNAFSKYQLIEKALKLNMTSLCTF